MRQPVHGAKSFFFIFINFYTTSIRTRQTKNVLCDETQDQIRRNRSNLVEPRFTKLSFDIVFLCEAESAIGLYRDVRRFPGSICRQQLGHIRFGAARLSIIEKLCRSNTHEVGGLNVGVCFGYRKLHTLILTDWTVKNDTLTRIPAGPFDK